MYAVFNHTDVLYEKRVQLLLNPDLGELLVFKLVIVRFLSGVDLTAFFVNGFLKNQLIKFEGQSIFFLVKDFVHLLYLLDSFTKDNDYVADFYLSHVAAQHRQAYVIFIESRFALDPLEVVFKGLVKIILASACLTNHVANPTVSNRVLNKVRWSIIDWRLNFNRLNWTCHLLLL